jgi:hypothetical protein
MDVNEIREATQPGFWVVSHLCFQTDDCRPTRSVVVAATKQEAVDKYNTLAKARTEYPHFWNQVGLENVSPLEVIV